MIKVGACKFIDGEKFLNPVSGADMPDDYAGNCLVWFVDGSKMIFHTGINQWGERYWTAVGNNPRKEYMFV